MRRLEARAPAIAARAGRELVLVVPRDEALPQGTFRGFRPGGVEQLLSLIGRRGRFLPRAEAEVAPLWQQVIPHLVVVSGDRVLTMRRLRSGSERRLRGQVTLGVGGHINADDGEPGEAWLAGCRREWREEVVCAVPLEACALGLIKDDSGEVGQVHLGVLLLVDAGAAPIGVREVEKLEGSMLPLAQLESQYLEMETWSQFIYEALVEGTLDRGSRAVTVSLPAAPAEPLGDC